MKKILSFALIIGVFSGILTGCAPKETTISPNQSVTIDGVGTFSVSELHKYNLYEDSRGTKTHTIYGVKITTTFDAELEEEPIIKLIENEVEYTDFDIKEKLHDKTISKDLKKQIIMNNPAMVFEEELGAKTDSKDLNGTLYFKTLDNMTSTKFKIETSKNIIYIDFNFLAGMVNHDEDEFKGLASEPVNCNDEFIVEIINVIQVNDFEFYQKGGDYHGSRIYSPAITSVVVLEAKITPLKDEITLPKALMVIGKYAYVGSMRDDQFPTYPGGYENTLNSQVITEEVTGYLPFYFQRSKGFDIINHSNYTIQFYYEGTMVEEYTTIHFE